MLTCLTIPRSDIGNGRQGTQRRYSVRRATSLTGQFNQLPMSRFIAGINIRKTQQRGYVYQDRVPCQALSCEHSFFARFFASVRAVRLFSRSSSAFNT